MKKIAILLIIVLSLTGCGRYESETVSISDLGAAVTFTAGLREYRSESLKNMDIAASYGIAPGEIDEGMVYYSAKDGCIDKIISLKDYAPRNGNPPDQSFNRWDQQRRDRNDKNQYY